MTSQRESFEKFISNKGWVLNYAGDGQYQSSSMQLTWQAWQACQATQGEQAETIAQLQLDTIKLRAALETLISIVGLTAFKHEGQRKVLQEAVDLGYKVLGETK